jgi:para-nitrobenzyl esterase
VPRDARDKYAAGVMAHLPPGPLASQSTEALLRAVAANKVRGTGYMTADGVVLPLDVRRAIQDGALHDVPTLVGVTDEEGKFFAKEGFRVSEKERFRAMMTFDPDRPGTLSVADLVGSREAFDAASATMTTFVHGLVDDTLATLGPKLSALYAMRFDWADEDEPWRTLVGSTHAMDLPFFFHHFGGHYFSCAFARRTEKGREALSHAMTESLAHFIRTGDPNVPALGVRWPRWRPDRPARLHWNASPLEAKITVE